MGRRGIGSNAVMPVKPSKGSLGANLEFLRALWAVNHEMETTSRSMRKVLGFTALERMVVRFVGRHTTLSPGDLAKLLHVHPSTLTLLLHRLVQRRILTRTTDPGDGRWALLRLTERGRALDIPSAGTVEAAVGETRKAHPPQDVERTIAVLEGLRGALLRGRIPR